MKISNERLKTIISNFKNANIFVVGDIIYDEYIYGDVSRISPEAPVPIVNVKAISFSAGGAANVCNNIASLGANVSLCGVVGNDSTGKSLIEYLNKLNINTDTVVVDKSRPTTKKTRIIAHNQQVVRIDKEEKVSVQLKIQRNIIESILDSVNKYNVIIFSDYGKGIITKNIISKTLPVINEKNIFSVVDPKPENFKLYKNASVMTPNKSEASRGINIKMKDEASIIKAGKKILKTLNLEALLLTRSEEGMSLFHSEEILNLPTKAQEVYDVTGAGDTVVSLLALGLAVGASYYESAIIANIAAGIVVKEIGCVSVSTNELLDNI